MNTWVLPFSRRNGFECRMRSRSRWNGVRSRQSPSSRSRPPVSYERTASGESHCCSCARTCASKAPATFPASSGMRFRLDDDRDGSAVGAPRGTGHVGRPLGAQKTDNGSDLLGLGEAPERPAFPDRLYYFYTRVIRARRLLVRETAFVEPCTGRRRARRNGVAADPVLGVEVGYETREREHRCLRHRVVRHPRRRALPRSGGHVHDDAAAGGAHRGQSGADATDVAHHVELPHRVPLVVGQVVEGGLVCLPHVVHEAIDRPDLGHESLGGRRIRQVGGHPEGRAALVLRAVDARRVAAGHDDTRALGHEELRGREPDAGGGARDEANAVAEAEVHRTASLIRLVTTLLLVRHGETEWNRAGRWQGHSDTPLNDAGREQARKLAAELSDVDVVYSSDLARARETAEILAQPLGLEVRVDPHLRERGFGAWEGKTSAEIEAEFGEEHARWLAGAAHGAEDAEPFSDFATRVRAFVDDVLEEHPDQTVLIVAHGGSVRAVHALAAGLDYVRDHNTIPGVANCTVTRFAARDGKLTPLD